MSAGRDELGDHDAREARRLAAEERAARERILSLRARRGGPDRCLGLPPVPRERLDPAACPWSWELDV